MKSQTKLVKHIPTGKIHKLLETYMEEGVRMAVTVQCNFISEPTATTDSWLGDWASFQKEFEWAGAQK